MTKSSYYYELFRLNKHTMKLTFFRKCQSLKLNFLSVNGLRLKLLKNGFFNYFCESFDFFVSVLKRLFASQFDFF